MIDLMDLKLVFNDDVSERINQAVEEIQNALPEISFEVWTEIPDVLKQSYYSNECIIYPNPSDFDTWTRNLDRRPGPIYSVALANGDVVSSVYSALRKDDRLMNLWATREDYRGQNIGKGVLLNLLRSCFERNPNLQVTAWDITAQPIYDSLISLGFTDMRQK